MNRQDSLDNGFPAAGEVRATAQLAAVARLDAAHGVICEAAVWPGARRGILTIYSLPGGDVLGAQPFHPARLAVPWWRLPSMVADVAGVYPD